MLKKRLIFTLLIDNGTFMLSRNFSLQSVGDLQWIKENYDFNSISAAIDELVVLNVGSGQKDIKTFAKYLLELSRGCFVPIAAGGGIRTLQDAEHILRSGADKLVLNTPIVENPKFVRALVQKYGSQCIVASIDYRTTESSKKTETYTRNGTKPTGSTVQQHIVRAQKLSVGEIYLTSINQDGTGMGYDIDLIRTVVPKTKIPVIPGGGAGNDTHFIDIIEKAHVMAVATANLFNFMSGGLQEARERMLKKGITFARWNV